MALYFNNKLQSEGKPLPGLLSTHRSAALIAIGWAQNKVTVVTDEGVKVATVAGSAAPTVVRWHPHLKSLLIGWRDGAITLWNEESTTQQDAAAHEGLAVLALEWTARGGYFLSSAKNGAVVLWQLDTDKANVMWSSKAEFPVEFATNLSSSNAKLDGDKPNAEDDTAFVVGGALNQAFLVEENQPQLVPLLSMDGDVTAAAVNWDSARRNLLVLASTNILYEFHIDFNMKATMQFKRKVSSGPGADLSLLSMITVAPGLTAISAGDSELRLLNSDQDVMYALPFPTDPTQGRLRISSICAMPSRQLLAAGTREGKVSIWCYCGGAQSTESEDWQQLACVEIGTAVIDQLEFTASGAVVALEPDAVTLTQKAYRKRMWSGTAAAIQVAPDTVVVETTSGAQTVVKCRGTVKELEISYPQLAVWTGRQVDLYGISDGSSSLQESFEQASSAIALHADGMLVVQGDRLLFLNYQKHPLAYVSFSAASDGIPQFVDVKGQYCVVVTSLNIMKLFVVKSRELQQVGPNRSLKNFIGEGRSPTCVKINMNGKKVAFLTRQTQGAKDDSLLWVYDLDTDHGANIDFAESGQIPEVVYWSTSGGVSSPSDNQMEALLLCCETRSAGGRLAAAAEEQAAAGGTQPNAAEEKRAGNYVWTLFATTMGTVVAHHSFALKRDQVCLVGCTVPNIILAVQRGGTAPADHHIELKRLRDFEGMQADADAKLRDALLQFSYHATVGNMDEAYRAVKAVKDSKVWQNMAKLCIATKRLDVAEVCLANMGDGLAARTLREARNEPQLEAKLGMLAVALGALEDAERLFRQCKRYDLLTELYVASGRWDEAERHAEAYDRIRMQPVKYRRAEHLERSGQVDAALQMYQKANCYGAEAPRLLYQLGRIEEIRQIASQTSDKELSLWWAQYLESAGDVGQALKQYQGCKDTFNAVRLLVTGSNPPRLDEAIDLLATPEGKASSGAAFFVGQYLEHTDVPRAVAFFDQAKAYRHAIRLAKENELFNEVVSLSLKCDDKSVASESANYFEARGQFDKAVQLYQKAGDTSRAIDVCIKGGLYDALHQISETLDSAADPETFISMAEHFINSNHFEKAVQMLVFAKAFNEALQLCMDKNVKLTDEMAEAMTLPKTESEEDEAYRISLLKKIAKVAKSQGLWHLACKKYTQAGERVKAMKMLLQSGDVEKVTFFANHSRNAEIYQLAGNFLQNQNWQTDANIYKNIVAFYTKAKAFEPLAGFYDAAAQVQIDEFRDYDKALATLKEAQKMMDKSDGTLSKKQLMSERVTLMETFVSARRMIKPGEPCPQMVSMCQELLAKAHRDHPMKDIVESAIRVGDVYALLVEYYDKLGQVENAYALIEKMLDQEIELTYFLEGTLIDKIYVAMGKDPTAAKRKVVKQQQQAPVRHTDEEVDYVDEDVD